MKINLTLAILYLTLFIVDIIYVRKSFQTYQISLILGLTISILSSLVLFSINKCICAPIGWLSSSWLSTPLLLWLILSIFPKARDLCLYVCSPSLQPSLWMLTFCAHCYDGCVIRYRNCANYYQILIDCQFDILSSLRIALHCLQSSNLL